MFASQAGEFGQRRVTASNSGASRLMMLRVQQMSEKRLASKVQWVCPISAVLTGVLRQSRWQLAIGRWPENQNHRSREVTSTGTRQQNNDTKCKIFLKTIYR
jgi:hypothetical protein